MNVLLVLIGLVGFCVSLIILIIRVIKRQSKKKMVIALISFFVFFCIGVAITDTNKGEEQANLEVKEETLQTEESAHVAETAQNEETKEEVTKQEKDSVGQTTVPNVEESAQTSSIRNENLNGRGNADVGRGEPDYINVIGYAVVSSDEEYDLKKTDDFQNEDYWQIPTYEKDKQFWNETEITLPHKTEVLVKEQYLEHKGWGNYSGYLLVETLEDSKQYYINVNNFITKPYWTYNDDLRTSALVGTFVAEYKQVSDFYPVNSSGDKVEIPDGTIVLVTGVSGTTGKFDSDENSIEAVVWKEWRLGYGGVEVYFNTQDLTIVY